MKKKLLLASTFVAALAFNQSASAGFSGCEVAHPAELPPIALSAGACDYLLQYFVSYQIPGLGPVILLSGRHGGFTNVLTANIGANQIENFDSTFTGTVDVPGAGVLPLAMTGQVTTEVFGKVGNDHGTFATEMLALNMAGTLTLPDSSTINVMIRESPTLVSPGEVSITHLPNNNDLVASYFRINSEMSIDGGLEWIPGSNEELVVILPEPSMSLLMGLGFGLLGFFQKRKPA